MRCRTISRPAELARSESLLRAQKSEPSNSCVFARIRNMGNELSPFWPPWHALAAGMAFILAVNAFAQRSWAIVAVTLLIAIVAATFSRVRDRR